MKTTTLTMVFPTTEPTALNSELRRLSAAILKARPEESFGGMGGENGYGSDIDTPVFTMHPHDENPVCNCGAEDDDTERPCEVTCPGGWPNFLHKPSGFAVWWHKWIGRSMDTKLRKVEPGALVAMIDGCIASIPGASQ